MEIKPLEKDVDRTLGKYGLRRAGEGFIHSGSIENIALCSSLHRVKRKFSKSPNITKNKVGKGQNFPYTETF